MQPLTLCLLGQHSTQYTTAVPFIRLSPMVFCSKTLASCLLGRHYYATHALFYRSISITDTVHLWIICGQTVRQIISVSYKTLQV